MNFDLSDDQKLLVDTVRSFCQKESPIARARGLREDARGWDPQVWAKMGELGWLSIAFPEAVGGLGGTFVDLGLILQQLGTTLAPEPLLASVALAGKAIELACPADQAAALLEPMLQGRSSLAFAHTEVQGRYSATDVATRAVAQDGGYTLSGEKRFVLNGHAAEQLVLSARTSGETREREGLSLFVVDARAPGVHVEPIALMDGQKAATVRLAEVRVPASALLGPAGSAASVLEHVLDYGAAATCCEGSGLMQTALIMTRNYLCERTQFGAKIGSFQALQHRAVDMFVETELAKSTAMLAMMTADEPNAERRARAISIAKVQLARGGGYVVRQATQLHGGIGVTDEHDIGLFFKRMHSLGTLFGDAEFHTARYSNLPSFLGSMGVAHETLGV